MPLYAMSGPDTIVSGIITLRMEVDEQIENFMFFVSGVLIAQGFDAWLMPNYLGLTVRGGATNWCEVDFDTRLFPNGVHQFYTTAWRPTPSSIIAESRGELNIQNDPEPPAVSIKPKSPAFNINGQRGIVRAMFGSYPTEFTQRPGLIEAYKAAGFNAIFAGVGINTVRDIQGCTQQQFEDAQQARINIVKDFCDANDIKAIADMMDWTYDQNAAIAMLQPPWIDAAMKNTFAAMVAAGCFIGCDLCDETEFRWSEENQLYARRISKAARLGKMPVCWTSKPPDRFEAINRLDYWAQGSYYSDYLSLGRDLVDWRKSNDPSVDQYYRGMHGAAYNIRTDCPALINTTCCTINLTDYHPLTEIGYALVLGAQGIKVYHLDTLHWKEWRAANPGSENQNYGSDPELNPGRWAAISHAMNAVAELEQLILQPQAPCEAPNRWMASRAWAGDAGRLQIAVSRLDAPQTVRIPEGYASGFVLGKDGRAAIDMNTETAAIPPGGWLVLTEPPA